MKESDMHLVYEKIESRIVSGLTVRVLRQQLER